MIDKAVIPLAGRGSRMRPVGNVVPKGLFPLPGDDESVRAVFHWILLEAASAGVAAAGVVVSPDRGELFERYLAALPTRDRAALPRVQWIVQPTPAGLGDALACAHAFTGEDPFLLMLGDHIHSSPPGQPTAAAQILTAFAAHNPAAMIGVHEIGPADLAHMGVCRGEPFYQGSRESQESHGSPDSHGSLFRCTAFAEKPDLATAQRDLVTPGLPPDRFLAHAGLYAFTPEIYRHISSLRPAAGERELATAQSALLAAHPADYLLARVTGAIWDVGNPAGYRAACAAALRHP
ncbi:MAG: sugar phosphate nucleotidyltransferase [Planctomycetota bacterium]